MAEQLPQPIDALQTQDDIMQMHASAERLVDYFHATDADLSSPVVPIEPYHHLHSLGVDPGGADDIESQSHDRRSVGSHLTKGIVSAYNDHAIEVSKGNSIEDVPLFDDEKDPVRQTGSRIIGRTARTDSATTVTGQASESNYMQKTITFDNTSSGGDVEHLTYAAVQRRPGDKKPHEFGYVKVERTGEVIRNPQRAQRAAVLISKLAERQLKALDPASKEPASS